MQKTPHISHVVVHAKKASESTHIPETQNRVRIAVKVPQKISDDLPKGMSVRAFAHSYRLNSNLNEDSLSSIAYSSLLEVTSRRFFSSIPPLTSGKEVCVHGDSLESSYCLFFICFYSRW